MLKYQHILLATCLSANSKAIGHRARTMANSAGAKLSVIHVMEPSSCTYASEFNTAIDLDFEVQLEQRLRATFTALADEFDITNDQRHFQMGSVKQRVVDCANAIQADLIIVGAHSHHGLSKLLGSTANAILHLATCDVLAIRVADA